VTIVSMRGEFGEQNPWQLPMGQGVRPVMEGMGLTCLTAERPEDVMPAATAAVNMAYKSNAGVGLLLSQRLLGAKAF
jgi:sulfopyruvate decarboxylase TPP-binding subunit